CRTHFETVKGLLDALSIPYSSNPRLVRGLDYYTRTAFEIHIPGHKGAQNAIGGGGRYDKLDGFAELGNSLVVHIGRSNNGDPRNAGANVWACASSGLYRIVEGEGVKERFWRGGSGRNYLPYDNIHHFYEDSEGIFWLATGGGGLLRLDPEVSGQALAKGETRQFSRKNGFPSDIIYAVYEDGQGQLWIPGDLGIIRFDKKTFQTRIFTTADGITHNEFNRNSHTRGDDGTLYFGGLNGVTAFHPKDFYRQDSSLPLPLVLTKFQQFDGGKNELLDRTLELDASRRITLHPGDRYFQLDFSLLSFTPERNLYAWRIEGLDKDWNYQSENTLRPGALPFGTNRLRIKAHGGDGLWSKNELVFEVVVLRPLWMRWWFIALSMLALAGGAAAFFRWRISQHRREQERLEREVERKTHEISLQNQQLEAQAEDLKRLDEVKSRFFANVSHELRTPLTLILSPLGSMLKRNRLENTDFTFAKIARLHGQDLLKRVNEILDLSKLDAGKLELHEAPVLALPFFQRLAATFESHAGRLGIQFSFQFKADKRLCIELDAAKLETIFNNLLSNALKFTPPGCKVSVLVEDEGSHLCLTVSDTGRGIHPADLPHVFDRFYQSQQPNSPVEGGTGIGLALCRELVMLMQGKLSVESELEKGSRFCLEFPKKQVLGVAAEPVADEVEEADLLPVFSEKANGAPLAPIAPTSNGEQRATVLVVEDNPSLRDYISLLLAEKYHVVTAENGQEALEGMRYEVGGMQSEHTSIPHTSYLIPDLIISDIMMPVMDGFQLLEKLKGDDQLRLLPVVMLTARADMQDKLKALRIGVDDYLLKPFEEDELLARVENLLKNYRERKVAEAQLSVPTSVGTESLPARLAERGELLSAEKAPETDAASPLNLEDMAWLENLETVALNNLGDFNLTADVLAEKMAVSRSGFYRRLKQLTGLTPAQYLDEVRFQSARRMLETRQVGSVKAASYAVGFRQEKHFSREFRTRFGRLPSTYLN
ncbi:MAG: ATP-binding protein, partial [Bacteroidota bacterium]